MFDINPELINQLVQRELAKGKMAEEYQIRPEEQEKPFQPKPLDPKWAMLLGGAADATSTFKFLKDGSGRSESNPMVKYFNKSPWAVVPTAAGMGIASNAIFNLMRKRVPSVANTASGLLGGFQMATAGKNMESAPNDPNAGYQALEALSPRKR